MVRSIHGPSAKIPLFPTNSHVKNYVWVSLSWAKIANLRLIQIGRDVLVTT